MCGDVCLVAELWYNVRPYFVPLGRAILAKAGVQVGDPDFSAMTPQEMMTHSESHIDMHSWQRASLFREALKKFEAENDSERAEELRRDLLLFSFAMRQGNDRRFIPQL